MKTFFISYFFNGSIPGGFGFGSVSLTFTKEELETHDIVRDIIDHIQNSKGLKEGKWTIVSINEIPTSPEMKKRIEEMEKSDEQN